MPDAGTSGHCAPPKRDTLKQNQSDLPTEMPYARIAVSGADAMEFLQGQLTHDLALLDDRPALRAAWCTPKGRVITVFEVTRHGDGFRLLLPAELAEDVVKRLTMFRFRSKVDFEIETLGDDDPAFDGDLEAWRLANLRAGIAEIAAAQSEEFTPHMLNLDLVDAVSFDKGCYTGQEIVARTHYRGSSKRRMYCLSCDAAVQPGDEILDGGTKAGTVVNFMNGELLAVVSSSRLKDTLTIGGATATLGRLPYELEDGGIRDATDD